MHWKSLVSCHDALSDPPLYFKMFHSHTPQIKSSLRCSLTVSITGPKEPLFHQDIMTDLKSYQDGLSQLLFILQFHTQFNLFNNNFESYYIANPALGNMDIQTNKRNLKFGTKDILFNHPQDPSLFLVLLLPMQIPSSLGKF